jgi:hypothetical protein
LEGRLSESKLRIRQLRLAGAKHELGKNQC